MPGYHTEDQGFTPCDDEKCPNIGCLQMDRAELLLMQSVIKASSDWKSYFTDAAKFDKIISWVKNSNLYVYVWGDKYIDNILSDLLMNEDFEAVESIVENNIEYAKMLEKQLDDCRAVDPLDIKPLDQTNQVGNLLTELRLSEPTFEFFGDDDDTKAVKKGRKKKSNDDDEYVEKTKPVKKRAPRVKKATKKDEKKEESKEETKEEEKKEVEQKPARRNPTRSARKMGTYDLDKDDEKFENLLTEANS
jgi:hypothetical protein